MKSFLIIFLVYSCFNLIPAETRFKRSSGLFEHVKKFCKDNILDFCSNENLKYMFWDKPEEYNQLVIGRQINIKDLSNNETDQFLAEQRRRLKESRQIKLAKFKSKINKEEARKLVNNIIKEFIVLFSRKN